MVALVVLQQRKARDGRKEGWWWRRRRWCYWSPLLPAGSVTSCLLFLPSGELCWSPSSSSSTATLQLRQPLAARQPRRQVEAETMREIVHIQAGQCGNQIGAKVRLQNHPPNVSKLFSSPQFCVFQVASCVRQRVRPLDLPVRHGTPSKGGALGAARGRF